MKTSLTVKIIKKNFQEFIIFYLNKKSKFSVLPKQKYSEKKKFVVYLKFLINFAPILEKILQSKLYEKRKHLR